MPSQAADPDPAAEQARLKALLQPSLDAYAAGKIDSQQLDARRADAKRRSTLRLPRPTRQMSCVVMVRPTVERVTSCWNYRFVQEGQPQPQLLRRSWQWLLFPLALARAPQSTQGQHRGAHSAA